MQEGQNGSSILRNTMVWPRSKVDLEHSPQNSCMLVCEDRVYDSFWEDLEDGDVNWSHRNIQCSDNVVSKHLLVSKCDSE